MRPRRVTSRNAAFQQWQALLDNRSKRHRTRSFLIQGVRPISIALEVGWEFEALIRNVDADPSDWAASAWESASGERVEMSAELIAELGERDGADAPELVAVGRMPADDLDRVPTSGTPLVVVLDRPSNPGNIGTLVRAADAFGASGLVVCGHAADVWDPRAVRASTGSMLTLPVVRADSAGLVLDWARAQGLQVVGTDETGTCDVRRVDWSAPTLLVIGNETRGMSATWREACDEVATIPMAAGAASSLNAAVAGSIVLHEAMRGRG